jgi:hypothetical protein
MSFWDKMRGKPNEPKRHPSVTRTLEMCEKPRKSLFPDGTRTHKPSIVDLADHQGNAEITMVSAFGFTGKDVQHHAPECITVFPEKLVLDVYEMADFSRGSKNRENWLRREDSSLRILNSWPFCR